MIDTEIDRIDRTLELSTLDSSAICGATGVIFLVFMLFPMIIDYTVQKYGSMPHAPGRP